MACETRGSLGRSGSFAGVAVSLRCRSGRTRLALATLVAATACFTAPARAQTPDDDLKVYAVNVTKTRPFAKQFTGYGVYLGNGKVITAAHVVGHWPALTHPRVVIGGQDLPAQVLKLGSLETTDLALLAIDQAQLPASLQLRRNPLCKAPSLVGAKTIVVYPERALTSRVISPLAIPSQYRATHSTLISDEQGSGSGVFDSERKCLLGIISQKVRKYNYRRQHGLLVASADGYAGYFVPAPAIAEFIPREFRF